ncbi:helix-turn-helix domain-containing protein [Streptomyces sp. CBMA156]|uniref:helix-turn-helix domain-containing protein n=1 Tax=Streptomyces sp. CBMA156 TaxID=1930280 RepID=UPI0016620621|nr:helix-turn-helix domain-containing protein [Streptomyces sp. CBMA156]MBD0673047.1 hypothetical protein [Streptomyces sp. CBMA156]
MNEREWAFYEGADGSAPVLKELEKARLATHERAKLHTLMHRVETAGTTGGRKTMAPTLHDLLGIDPNDPRTAAALEDSEAYAELVESLVVARQKRGLTQREVAQRMGTSQSTVSEFERIGGDARYSTLQRYARAIGARLHIMVGHTCSAVAPA